MADLIKTLPFIFGAAISPVLLVTVLYILSRPYEPVKKAIAFLLGSALIITAVSTMIFYSTTLRPNPTPRNDLLPHLIIGFLLLLLAFDIYHRGPVKSQHKANKNDGLWKYFGVGVVLMVTNFTTIAMVFEVALNLRAFGIQGIDKIYYLLATILFSLIPALLPLIILASLGKRAHEVLEKLSGFMSRYSHIVTSIFFAAIGAFVLTKPFI